MFRIEWLVEGSEAVIEEEDENQRRGGKRGAHGWQDGSRKF
jgi:hypothetical protein